MQWPNNNLSKPETFSFTFTFTVDEVQRKTLEDARQKQLSESPASLSPLEPEYSIGGASESKAYVVYAGHRYLVRTEKNKRFIQTKDGKLALSTLKGKARPVQ